MSEAPPRQDGSIPARRLLERALIAGIAVLSAVALAGGSAFLYRARRQAVAEWDIRLSAVATDRQRLVESWLDERSDDAALVGAFPSVVAGLERARDQAQTPLFPHLGEVLTQMQQKGEYEGVYVVDVEGNLIAGIGDPVLAVQLNPLFAPQRDVAVLTLDGTSMVGVRSLVTDPQNPRVALGYSLVVSDPGRALWPFLREAIPTDTGETLIVRREGDAVAFMSPRRFESSPTARRMPLATENLAAAAALQRGEHFGRYRDYRGVPVLAATRPIRGTDWAMVRKIDAREAFEEYRDTRWHVLVLAVVVTALVAAVLLEISRRHRMRKLESEVAHERSLRMERDRYRALSENAHDLVLFVDESSRIVDANHAAQRAYGYDREELEKMSILDLVAEDSPTRSAADLVEAMGRGLVFESRHRRRDGSVFPVEASTAAATIAGQRILIAVVRDISERKRDEAAAQQALERLRDSEMRYRQLSADLERLVQERTASLQAANRELETFNYSVSHDLRAPLRHIEGFIQILLEDHGAELSEEVRRLLDQVAAGSRRMVQLVDALLQLSRVGRAEIQRRPVDLAVIACAAFDELCPPGRNVDFVVATDLPAANGDPLLLRQVFDNLLGNALKFSRGREAPRIEVGAVAAAGVTAYFVRDNGVGFDPRYADKLFGAFQRLHSQVEFEGTGIGLSVVARIVHRHGGSVRAEGVPGEGATFFFTLPPPAADGTLQSAA